jgi:SPP1 gp7 family putative phage head morphogenesis protein
VVESPGERFGDRRPRTANEKLLWDYLKHAHYLERLTASEVKRVERFLSEEVLPDVLGKLVARLEKVQARGYDTGFERTRRGQRLFEEITALLDDAFSEARKSNATELQQLSKYEANWQVASLERSVPKEIGLEFTLPPPGVLKQLVSERPIIGQNLGEWWDNVTVASAQRIERQVRIGIAQGESVPDIVRRIRGNADGSGPPGVFEITKREAEAVVRNAAIHVSNQARQEVYKANADVIEGEIWTSTLDTSTCIQCATLDGKRFATGEGPMPPLHPLCRCGRRPEVKTLNQIMAEHGHKIRFKELSPSTRASMHGPVSETLTYGEWLNELDPDELREAIGATRAGLWKSGKLKLDRMVDQSGRALTLAQIAKREGIEF